MIVILVCLKCYYTVIVHEEWCNSQSVSFSSCGSGQSLRHWPWPSTETCDSGSKGHGEELSIRRCPLRLSWWESVAVTRLGATAVTFMDVRFLLSDRDWHSQETDAFSPCLNVIFFFCFLEADFSVNLIGVITIKLQWVIALLCTLVAWLIIVHS